MGTRTRILAVLFLIAFATGRAAGAPDPAIAAVASKVLASGGSPGADTYEEYLDSLPVDEGAARGYFDDGSPQPDLLLTRAAIESALAASVGAAGGTVDRQDFSAGGLPGRNFLAVLPGQGPNALHRYVLGAHYDSSQVPGADDNGSGVAGVLLAARVCPATVRRDPRLRGFDREEQRPGGWVR